MRKVTRDEVIDGRGLGYIVAVPDVMTLADDGYVYNEDGEFWGYWKEEGGEIIVYA